MGGGEVPGHTDSTKTSVAIVTRSVRLGFYGTEIHSSTSRRVVETMGSTGPTPFYGLFLGSLTV